LFVVWSVAGKALVTVQPVIATSTVLTPSLNVPTQSAGTISVVKVNSPPLVAAVTTRPSHVMMADFTA
jgi:hypothetical protein